MSVWNQLYFPDANSEMAMRLYYYHDLVMVVVVMVLILVLSFMILFLFSKFLIGESSHLNVTKNEPLELFWSTFPFCVLVILGFVSLKNLYDMEVGDNVKFTIKVTGHQWYWEYRYEVDLNKVENKLEYNNFVMHGEFPNNFSCSKEDIDFYLDLNNNSNNNFSNLFGWSITSSNKSNVMKSEEIFSEMVSEDKIFDFNYEGENTSVLSGIFILYLSGEWFYSYDSYMVPEEYLKSAPISVNSGFRNQDVSIPCIMMYGEKNEVLVSTADVFHSWGVTELGVKADAVPGRVNSLKVIPIHSSMAYGFCYELCGAGHSQMPIVVMIVSPDSVNWIIKKGILLSDNIPSYIESLS